MLTKNTFKKKLILANALCSGQIAISQERITVTSSQSTHRSLLDESSSIVISSEEIESKGYRYLDQVLKDIAGLTVVKDSSLGGNTSIFVRGASSGQTLVLIDGVRLNDSSSTNTGFSNGSLMARHIERIEILKGPQSILYGSSAIGGVINIVTKKISEQSSQLSYQAEAGSNDLFSSAIQLSGKTDENFYYQGSMGGLSSSGISAADDPDGDQEERDGIRQYYGQVFLKYDIQANTSASLQYRNDHADNELDAGAGKDDPNYSAKNQQEFVNLRFDHNYLAGTMNSIIELSALDISRSYNNEADAMNENTLKLDFEGQTFNASLINTILMSSSEIVFGLEWLKEQAKSISDYNNTATATGWNNKETYSLFAQSKWQATEWLQVDSGLRYDHLAPISSVNTYQIGAAFHFHPLSPRIRLNHATGYKSPSLEQLYSNYGSKDLKAEESSFWEIALSQSIFKFASLEVSYFENTFEDLIDFGEDFKYVNIKKAYIKGLESALKLNLNTYLSMRINYTYLNARDLESDSALPRRPTNQYGLFTQSRWNDWEISVTGTLRSELPGNSFSKTTPWAANFDSLLAYQISPNHRVWGRLENLANDSSPLLDGYKRPSRSWALGVSGSF